jgi:putative membrane protein
MEDIFNMKMLSSLVSALIFSIGGLVAFAISYGIFDIVTPKVSVWKEIVEKQNLAVSVFLAAMIIGISMIISAAIHG